MKPRFKNLLQVFGISLMVLVPPLFWDGAVVMIGIRLAAAVIALVFIAKSPSCFNWIGRLSINLNRNTVLSAMLLGVTLFLLTTTVLEPLLVPGAHTTGQEQLKGNTGLLLIMLLSVFLLSGVVEEIIFRGFLQERMLQITRNSWLAWGITTFIFGIMHTSSGLGYVYIGLIVGGILGAIYQAKQNLLLVVIAHAMSDGLPFILVYADASHWLPVVK